MTPHKTGSAAWWADYITCLKDLIAAAESRGWSTQVLRENLAQIAEYRTESGELRDV